MVGVGVCEFDVLDEGSDVSVVVDIVEVKNVVGEVFDCCWG